MMQYALFLVGLRKQFGHGHADRAPAAVRAVPGQLLQLDVQRCGQPDGGSNPGLPRQPLAAQQPADRSDVSFSLPNTYCMFIKKSHSFSQSGDSYNAVLNQLHPPLCTVALTVSLDPLDSPVYHYQYQPLPPLTSPEGGQGLLLLSVVSMN